MKAQFNTNPHWVGLVALCYLILTIAYFAGQAR